MSVRLPSRYEDLDPDFRSKLRPVPELNSLVQEAYASMKTSGGIRFLPIFGKRGSGKTCAACELSTHFPSSHLSVLKTEEVSLPTAELTDLLSKRIDLFTQKDLFIWVVDQYEERVQTRGDLPKEFIEKLSLLDRGALRNQPMIFIWLTTDQAFQASLAAATSRNERILAQGDYELKGIAQDIWPTVIEETFSFHNDEQELAHYGVLEPDIKETCKAMPTIGKAIEEVGRRIGQPLYRLQDLSEYQVILLWPVVDGTGIERVTSLTNPLGGYKLNWNVWYNRLSDGDKKQLPLRGYNQARLYFDFRLVPIPVADLHSVSAKLDDETHVLAPSYLEQFKKTHYYTVLAAASADRAFGTLRERESQRARDARAWYEGVTASPTKVGRRLANCLSQIGFPSKYEREIRSDHSRVVADVLSKRQSGHQTNVITELKLFSSAQTTPANIRDEIRKTLRKYAQLAGYVPRQ